MFKSNESFNKYLSHIYYVSSSGFGKTQRHKRYHSYNQKSLIHSWRQELLMTNNKEIRKDHSPPKWGIRGVAEVKVPDRRGSDCQDDWHFLGKLHSTGGFSVGLKELPVSNRPNQRAHHFLHIFSYTCCLLIDWWWPF